MIALIFLGAAASPLLCLNFSILCNEHLEKEEEINERVQWFLARGGACRKLKDDPFHADGTEG
jgi:hypothetical protein